MNKPPFLEELEKRLRPEERIFKFRNAELCGNSFLLELLVDRLSYDSMLDDALMDKVKKASEEIIPKSFSLNLRFIKANNEENALIKHLMEYIYKDKPTLYSGFQSAQVNFENKGSVILLTITLEKYLYEYAINSGLKSDLEKSLSATVMEDVEVEFVEIPNSNEEFSLSARKQPVLSNALRTINVSIDKYYTGNIAQSPRYIADMKGGESSQACVCGVISNVKVRFIEKIDKNLFSFLLNDTTGTIKVKYFAKKIKSVVWEEVLKDGEALVMEGQIKFDKFDNEYAFFPRNIAKCIIDYNTINLKVEYKPEPEKYIRVFPQKIEVGTQFSLISVETNPTLRNNTFVVFDLETTGLEASEDKIIEIAGIKIVDGEICESFSCLVNPKMPLPAKIIEITNITDEMLKEQYSIDEVIGDFYKFTRGAILVAHNAPFDMGFLGIAGKNNRYNFDNEFMDTLSMARQKLKRRSNDLGSLCKYFNISLVDAHRAINDALATAKLFIELMNLR